MVVIPTWYMQQVEFLFIPIPSMCKSNFVSEIDNLGPTFLLMSSIPMASLSLPDRFNEA